MPFVENLDFLNANSVRSFPIKEGSPVTTADGMFTIPDNFMVDMEISASSDVTLDFKISKIYNYTEAIIVEVTASNGAVLGTFTVQIPSDPSTFIPYTTVYLASSQTFIGANGRMVVGSIETMRTLPVGVFNFSSTWLETRCVIPSRSTINRFLIIDEKGNEFGYTGTIKFLARNNLRFRQSGDTVIMDAGDGLGLNRECEEQLPCIKTINNVAPDSDGNFSLLGIDCAQFSPMSDPPGLTLDDTCCKPCMGCEEIGQLTERAIQVESDLLKLRDYFTNLQTVIATFEQTTNYSCEC